MLPKDFLALWLSGTYSMDYSDAAGTLLLDSEKNCWSAEILNKFAIPEEILPTLFESAAEVGTLVLIYKQNLALKKKSKSLLAAPITHVPR